MEDDLESGKVEHSAVLYVEEELMNELKRKTSLETVEGNPSRFWLAVNIEHQDFYINIYYT